MFTRVQQAGAAMAACAVLLVAAHASAQQPQRRDITLQVGEQSSIPADGVRNYSEGVPNVVDVRLPRDNSQFIIVALHPGQTTLLLTMDDGSQVLYRIVVTSGTETTLATTRMPSTAVAVETSFSTASPPPPRIASSRRFSSCRFS